MALNMPAPWKHPKTGVYWLRRRVPEHLRLVVGKTEERATLGTKDPVEAKRRYPIALAELDAKWASLAAGSRQISEVEALDLARPFYQQLFASFADNPSRQNQWDIELGRDCFAPAATITQGELITFTDKDIRRLGLETRCRDLAVAHLAAKGIAVDDAGIRVMAMAIARAFQTAALDLHALARGNFGTYGSAQALQRVSAEAKPKALSSADLVAGWKVEKRPTSKTEYAFRRVLNELMHYLGHDDVRRIAPADISKWKAALLGKGLAAKTVRDSKLAPVRALLQWGVDNSKLSVNPASRLGITLKQKAGEGRRGYTDEEAAVVLAAAAKEKGYKRWVPLLCAYSGARISEVCQLRRQDIKQIGGIWCMSLVADAGSLKNAGSERVVPLHPSVMKAGFLGFVEKRSNGPLFVDLSPDRFGSRGGNGTRLIGRWVRSLGLVDARISPSHSWRHRFKTLARRHGIAPDISDAITGHAPKSVGDSYGEFEPKALLRELSKLP